MPKNAKRSTGQEKDTSLARRLRKCEERFRCQTPMCWDESCRGFAAAESSSGDHPARSVPGAVDSSATNPHSISVRADFSGAGPRPLEKRVAQLQEGKTSEPHPEAVKLAEIESLARAFVAAARSIRSPSRAIRTTGASRPANVVFGLMCGYSTSRKTSRAFYSGHRPPHAGSLPAGRGKFAFLLIERGRHRPYHRQAGADPQ